MTQKGDSSDALGRLPQPEVCFNYMGRFDNVLPDTSPFVPIEDSIGPNGSPDIHRVYLLNISAWVVRGKLVVEWRYSRNVHKEKTIDRIATDFMDEVRHILND